MIVFSYDRRTKKIPHLSTIDGGTDFSEVTVDDYVASGPEGGRKILLPAGQVLTETREPIADAPDGSTRQLDGGYTVKLGGEIIARTEPPVQ